MEPFGCKTVSNGDFMVWAAAGWSIMAGEMNPILYYRLDGSQALTGPFAGGGQVINDDAATVGQASTMVNDLRDEVEAADQGLQDQIDDKSDIDHKHIEADITDLDKYTQSEVDTRLNDKEDDLGSPGTDGQVLSSLTDGTRSWVNLPDGAQPVEWGGISGTISNQTDLQDSLNTRSYIGHVHTESEITDLDKYTQTEVNNLLYTKSDVGHDHDGDYAPVSHQHQEIDIVDLDKYTRDEVNSFVMSKADTAHVHTESDITDLNKYTRSEVDNLISGHNHNSDYYQKNEFVDFSSGVGNAGDPIVLDAQGQIDPSMLDVSVFHYVGTFTPVDTLEYPDTSGESYGAFWVIQGLSGDYTFVGGDLIGKIISNGDFMVWAAAGWSIMAGEMNPILYYRLDGSQALTGPFAGGSQVITNIADGVQATDAATVGQASTMVNDLRNDMDAADQNLQTQIDDKSDIGHTHTESEITDLDKYTQGEVDNLLGTKSDTAHNHDGIYALISHNHDADYAPVSHDHTEADITDLDKYTQAEVNSRLSSKEDTLGSPITDGYVLSSSTDGTRSWISLPTSTVLEWGNITGVISNQTDLQDSLNAKAYVVHNHVEADITDLDKYTQTEVDNLLSTKSDVGHNHDADYAPVLHDHTEADITDLDKYTVAEVDNLLAGKSDDGHNHDGEYYLRSEFIRTSSGVNDAGKPILLDGQGQIDPSMLDVSVFYYVGPFTPADTLEYPNPSSETHGAFWVVQGLSGDYTFTTGDLIGKTVSNGDFMVWSAAGWSIMAGEMNPILYYRLDGSQAITDNFQAGNFKLINVADGVSDSDAVNVKQLNTKANAVHSHVETDITDLDKYTKAEVDGLIGSIVETDPVFTSWGYDYGDLVNTPTIITPNPVVQDVTVQDTTRWGSPGQITETDPIFSNHLASSITSSDTTRWAIDTDTDTQLSDSDISSMGYIKSYTETDPIFTSWGYDYNDLVNKPSFMSSFSTVYASSAYPIENGEYLEFTTEDGTIDLGLSSNSSGGVKVDVGLNSSVITEAYMDISNNPITNGVLTWTGTAMQWETPNSGGMTSFTGRVSGSSDVTVSDGDFTYFSGGDGIHLDLSSYSSGGYELDIGIPENGISESKLDVLGSPVTNDVLTWTGTGMDWVASSSGGMISFDLEGDNGVIETITDGRTMHLKGAAGIEITDTRNN